MANVQTELVSGGESRILIIMTGGTICMQPSANGLVPARGFLRSGLAPRPSFNDGSPSKVLDAVNEQGTRETLESLRTPPTAYNRRVRFAVLEFDELLDSSSIDAVGWTSIADTIYRNYQTFDGFVVLHGTDSLAYTCSALSFMLQDLGKPVVFTGSQVPMAELQNDATDNLLGSLVVASHFMIPEVCLFFNYNLYRGNRTTKIAAADFAAFSSPNHPPLATVSAAGTKVMWHLVQRPTTVRRLSLQTNLRTAHVACLRIFPGIKPEMVAAVLQLHNLKGLVLETFGAGNAPGGPDSAMTKCLADAVKRGIVVVNVTQCLSGNVSPLYAPATILGRAGVVFGHDMTSEAALTKLSYLLGIPGASPEWVADQMSASLRGELTESFETQFQHPSNEQLSPRTASLTTLGHAIAKGNHAAVRDIIRQENKWLLNDADYLGNTPLHLAAVGPNISILRDFLEQGASVHLRNHAGHTPLFLAADASHEEHVKALSDAGAHLHPTEIVETFRHAAMDGDSDTDRDATWDLALQTTNSH